MPTPASGAISMENFRSEITRSGGSVSMNELRTRYGGSGAISFADLYDTEGFVITADVFTFKFDGTNGWGPGVPGSSIFPVESGANGRIQFAASSFFNSCTTSIFTPNDTQITISFNNAGNINGNSVTAGYKTTDITRVVLANTSRTITAATSDANNSSLVCTYSMPSSGEVYGLIQF